MENPFKTTGLRHGTGDPRGLIERIDAQLAERIEQGIKQLRATGKSAEEKRTAS